LRDFLEAFKCDTVLFPNDYGLIIRITNEQTIGEAFKRMLKHQMMAIPVICPLTGRPLYILSMMHIMQYLLDHLHQEDFRKSLWNKIVALFDSKEEHFKRTEIRKLEACVDYDLDGAYTIMKKSSLVEALKLMADKKCHRLLVTNSKGDLVNVITQSRLLQFIAPFVDSIPKCYSTLQELGLGFKEVVSVNEHDSAYSAFKKMRMHRVPGIAVVDHNGVLTGSISISDLKLIGFDTMYWNLLGKSVKEYMLAVRSNPDVKIRPSVFALLEDRSKPFVVKCKAAYSFGFVIRMFSYYKVHRIFMVDDEGLLKGMVTMSDVINEILKQ